MGIWFPWPMDESPYKSPVESSAEPSEVRRSEPLLPWWFWLVVAVVLVSLMFGLALLAA